MAVLMHNGIHFNHLLSFVKVTRPDFYKVLPFLLDAYTAYFVFHLSPFTIFGFSKSSPFSLTKDEAAHQINFYLGRLCAIKVASINSSQFHFKEKTFYLRGRVPAGRSSHVLRVQYTVR